MSNELICLVDMFTSEVEIIYPDSSRDKVPSMGVIEYLYDTCKTEGLNTLHLFGNKKYLEGLITEYPPLEYGCRKLEVKIN